MAKPKELPGLTALRGIAALCIAVTHFAVTMKFSLFGYPINIAPIGMPLFFTLSGFIVHYVYADPLKSDYRTEVKKFAISRFARIYPLFALLLVFYSIGSFGIALLGRPDVLISYATLTGSWWYWTLNGLPLIDTPYGISWSISTEAFFYFTYAAGLFHISAIQTVRTCIIALLALSVGALTGLGLIYAFMISNGMDLSDPFYRWVFYVSPYFHLLEFIGGCLTCQLVLVGKGTRLFKQKNVDALTWAGILWIGGALCLLYVSWHSGHSIWLLHYVNFLHMTFLMAPGCLLLILAAATSRRQIGVMIVRRAFIFVGDISYSIYLTHMLVVRAAVSRLLIDHPILATLLAPVALIAISTASYRLVERPARSWIRRAMDKTMR